jgi:hypothetical protein
MEEGRRGERHDATQNPRLAMASALGSAAIVPGEELRRRVPTAATASTPRPVAAPLFQAERQRADGEEKVQRGSGGWHGRLKGRGGSTREEAAPRGGTWGQIRRRARRDEGHRGRGGRRGR